MHLPDLHQERTAFALSPFRRRDLRQLGGGKDHDVHSPGQGGDAQLLRCLRDNGVGTGSRQCGPERRAQAELEMFPGGCGPEDVEDRACECLRRRGYEKQKSILQKDMTKNVKSCEERNQL